MTLRTQSMSLAIVHPSPLDERARTELYALNLRKFALRESINRQAADLKPTDGYLVFKVPLYPDFVAVHCGRCPACHAVHHSRADLIPAIKRAHSQVCRRPDDFSSYPKATGKEGNENPIRKTGTTE